MHLIGCGVRPPYTLPGNGFMYIDGEVYGDGELQPVVAPDSVPTLKEIYEHLSAGGWEAEFHPDEGVVVVRGIESDRYSVDASRAVYGEGPLLDLLRRAVAGA